MNITEKDKFPLSYQQLSLALAIKILLACLYGYIFLRYYGGDDTWQMHREGIIQSDLLKSNPGQFFRELAPAAGIYTNDTLKFIQLYLQDLEFYIQAKTLAIFNLLTAGNYYLNAVLFSLVIFWGHYWLFRLLNDRFPGNKNLLYLVIFLFLPAVFWVSGIRSDSWLFFFTALMLFSFNRSLRNLNVLSLMSMVAGFAGMLVFRAPYALLLLPALLAWALTEKGNKRISVAIVGVYGISLLLFFGSFYLSNEHAATRFIVDKQQAFFALEGKTRYNLDTLQPDPLSFAKVLPQAIANTILRPYPWEAKGPLQLLSVVENLIILMTVFLFLTERRRNSALRLSPAFWSLLLFAFSLYLLIGFIVPFPGAIVRYRSIPEMIVFSLLLMHVSSIRNTLS